MIKMTVAQAMEAIRKETTTDGMKAVLMNCTKADIVKVHEELIGAKYEYSVSRKKKAELCIHVAVRVQNARENEAFRALTVNEKLCKLKESNFADMENQFSLCTTEELRTMVGMLGVSADISEDSPFWEGHGFWCMLMGNALSALRFEPQVMGIVEAGASVEEVCIRLYRKPMMVIQAMIERAGLEAYNMYEEEHSEAILRLARHYVETEQRVKTAGDNSARMEVSHADGEAKIFLQPEGIIQEEGMITISADTRAMLVNKYAEIRVTMHAFFDGMRIFRRGVEIRRKQGLTSEGLLHGIEVAKAEYRKLRVESLNLRKKLLEVMSWKKILEGCKQYAARCGRVRRRYIGK